jgi:hypothetical protein
MVKNMNDKKQITTTELIQEPFFREKVKANLESLLKTRRNRPEPKAGFKYSRDWYDRMSEKGVLNADYFLTHIDDIWHKRSKLNAETRNIILAVCNVSVEDYIRQTQAEEKDFKDKHKSKANE